MVICAFENPPSIPSLLATQIVYIYGQFKKINPFPFIFPKRCSLSFKYFIAPNNSVLLVYACAHEISLKYLFLEEKNAIEICCQKYQECNTFCVTNFFPLNFKIMSNKKYQIYILDIMKL